MTHLLLSVVLLLFSIQVSSQTLSYLLKNPAISWVVEVEHDWILDLSTVDDSLSNCNQALVKKWIQPRGLNFTMPNEFARQTILASIKTNKLLIFRDKECSQHISWEDLAEVDTIIHNCTNEPMERRQFHELEEFFHFRVWQMIFYNTRKMCFGSTPASVAVTFNEKDAEGNFTETMKPLCWFKASNLEPKNALVDQDISLIIETWSRSGKNLLDMKNAKVLKKPAEEFEPRKHLFQVLANPKPKQKSTVFHKSENFELSPLTLEERQKIVAWQDSTEEYDYSTQQTNLKTEKHQILPEEIKHFRLVQKWFWDDRKKRLFIHLESVAPMLEVYGSEGEFRYRKPLFYRVSE